MRLLVPGAVLLALLGAGCGDAESTSAEPAAPRPDLPDNVAVFGPDDLADDDASFSGGSTWEPTSAEVLRADAALRARVARTPGVDTPYADFVRQYTGLEDDVVLVNALCDGGIGDWREEWITVTDGGSCFWQAAVRDGEVVSFSVNGEA